MNAVVHLVKEVLAFLLANKVLFGLIKDILIHIREAKVVDERKVYAQKLREEMRGVREKAMSDITIKPTE